MTPTLFNILILCSIIGGFTLLLLRKQQSPDDSKLENAQTTLGKLQAELELSTKEKIRLEESAKKLTEELQELRGKNKAEYAQKIALDAELQVLRGKTDDLTKQLSRFESEKEERDRRFSDNLHKLSSAEKALEEERIRVRKEEEEQGKLAEENRDRIWNEHEQTVISNVIDLCKQPQYGFTTYTNTQLPEGFTGHFKPDIVIDFLGQHLVIDAKHSKADNMQIYINDTVKKTAEKIRKHASTIYPIVLLVIPTPAIVELKKTYYPMDELTFFVITPESIPPILYALKQITKYELAEQLDPQKRENLINIISDLDWHIRSRNTFDILMSQNGSELLSKIEKIDETLTKDIEQKLSEKKILTFAPSDIKKLSSSLTHQDSSIQEMTEPKTIIKKKDLETMKETVLQTLL